MMKFILTVFCLLIPHFAFAQVPTGPTGLQLVAGKTITLTWTDTSSNELCFPVETKVPGATDWKFISCSPRNSATYLDKQYVPGKYCYRVKAINDGGDSAYSNEACIDFAPAKPQPPTLSVKASLGVNILTWTPSDEAVAIHIWRGIGATWGYRDREVNQFGVWYDRTVADGIKYCYRARFINLGGESVDSPVVCSQ